MADLGLAQLLEHFKISNAQPFNVPRRRQEEVWIRKRELGCGSYGTAYLEEFTPNGKVHAVKEIRKRVDSILNMSSRP